MKTVLFFSRDPGPTNQLVAVHARLSGGGGEEAIEPLAGRAVGCRLVVYGKPPGDLVWRRNGIEPIRWPEQLDESGIDLLLADSSAIAVATGTSDVDETIDRRLWRAAKRCGIESHVFLDHIANLESRFSELSGAQTLPDWIYAPADSYRARLESIGVPRGRIVVAGDLHLARLSKNAPKFDRSTRAKVRSTWGVRDDQCAVLFASECAAEMAEAGRPRTYDEFATLERLIEMVRAREPIAGVSTGPDTTVVVVRPHPRDRDGKYRAWLDISRPRLIVSAEGAPIEAVRSADVVVGMDSTLLREALTVGCPTASLVGAELT